MSEYIAYACAQKLLAIKMQAPNRPETESVLELIHGLVTAGHFQASSGGRDLEAYDQTRLPRLRAATAQEIKSLETRIKSAGGGEDAFDDVEKADAVKMFGKFYHLLSAETNLGRFYRSIVEKLFEILELGPIPPDPYKDQPAARHEGGAARA